MQGKDLGKTSVGLEANVAGLLCYSLGWITGIIFFLIEKENKFVRFHALQSIVVFGFFTVLGMALFFIPILGWMAMPVIGLIDLALWIILMIKAAQGEYFKLPIAGDIAEKSA